MPTRITAADVSRAAPGEPSHWLLRHRHRQHIDRVARGDIGARSPVDESSEGTRFLKSVRLPEEEANLTKSGIHSPKIGDKITKGRWRGMKIRTLTLEERRTCPRACENWTTCYGNNMPFSRRLVHGEDLEVMLFDELERIAAARPVVVRLHVLGDFYSLDYVRVWRAIIERLDVRVFGYTAHEAGSEIGAALATMSAALWERFSLRFSGRYQPPHVPRAITVRSKEEAAAAGAVVCPAQTGDAPSCAACGFCWHSTRTVAFLEH